MIYAIYVNIVEALGWEPIDPEGSMYGMFFHHMDSDKAAVVEGTILKSICIYKEIVGTE